MHFTRVRMLKIPYFLLRNIENMAYLVSKKEYHQQLNSLLYHQSLIKLIVLDHLNLLNISWDTFTSNDIFKNPQIPPPISQERREASASPVVAKTRKHKVKSPRPVKECNVTYQRGLRELFAAERRVIAPHGVEGTFPSSSTQRKMFAPHGVEGAFHSSSTTQVH